MCVCVHAYNVRSSECCLIVLLSSVSRGKTQQLPQHQQQYDPSSLIAIALTCRLDATIQPIYCSCDVFFSPTLSFFISLSLFLSDCYFLPHACTPSIDRRSDVFWQLLQNTRNVALLTALASSSDIFSISSAAMPMNELYVLQKEQGVVSRTHSLVYRLELTAANTHSFLPQSNFSHAFPGGLLISERGVHCG